MKTSRQIRSFLGSIGHRKTGTTGSCQTPAQYGTLRVKPQPEHADTRYHLNDNDWFVVGIDDQSSVIITIESHAARLYWLERKAIEGNDNTGRATN
ncbi:hypothetical protein [Gynuella sp.]|uniref:hypothetical protein n=1 Tax=Gynuella sp. TaxID=2969146 RepID=UPI003D09A947